MDAERDVKQCQRNILSRSTKFISVVNLLLYFFSGKQGSKIKELQEASGARIKVLKDESTGSETPVELTGSECGLQIGKQLIESLCQEDGYGRGGSVRINLNNMYIGRIIGKCQKELVLHLRVFKKKNI